MTSHWVSVGSNSPSLGLEGCGRRYLGGSEGGWRRYLRTVLRESPVTLAMALMDWPST
ncbi:hypothetical protein D3C84_713750 [compost metagenome]